ncbi:hypothetical protein ACSFCK_05375 [Brevibacterium luteolum]|uniref:hypothetical protein n=1 Tax=Brevibacterium luteolum TaxID=199591 RepID=UPI003EF01F63
MGEERVVGKLVWCLIGTEGVADDEAEGIVAKRRDLCCSVTCAQLEGRGAGQVEPLADVVEELLVDVDGRLSRTRPGRIDLAGQ